jgi:hypothetical protein
MPDLIKIPAASAEMQARFERPYIGFIGSDRPRAVEAVVSALMPFNFRLSNTELVTTGSLADHKVIFKLPDRGITFQFGAEEYRFTKDGSNWETANEDIRVLMAAEHALLEGTAAKVTRCLTTVAVHLQPLTKPREEVLAPFFPEPFRACMPEGKADTFAAHLKWANGDILIDFSTMFANGIFLRFSSQFDGHPPLAEILTKVRNDEEAIFAILGVQEASAEQ